MGQAVSTLAQAYLVDPSVFSDMLGKISGSIAMDSMMSTAQMSRASGSLASGYASAKHVHPLNEDQQSSVEFMRTVPPSWSSALGGIGPRLRAKTISHRLVQECSLPPLSLFETTHGPSPRPTGGVIHGAA